MSIRMYGRWERPRSAGFFGLTWGGSMVGLTLIVTVMVGFLLTRSLSVALGLTVGAAIVFVPVAVTIRGRTGWELVLLRIQFVAARARGEHIYRAGRFARIPGVAKLPGLLA